MSGQSAEVTAYDSDVGLGTVTMTGGEQYRFHCTAIADGSRDIALGTAVVVDIGPAGPGVWEARRVVPAGPIQ